MDRNAIEQVFSKERIEPYLKHHDGDFEKAVVHYKANIAISQAFYPALSILEIGLRNNLNYQLQRYFKVINWFENSEFIKIVSRFQIDKISEARNSILNAKKEI